jgi:hypothetical protein
MRLRPKFFVHSYLDDSHGPNAMTQPLSKTWHPTPARGGTDAKAIAANPTRDRAKLWR